MRLWNYAVKVGDLDAAAASYTDTMGGELRLSGRVFGCDYWELRLGGTRLLLFTKAPYEDLLDEPLPLAFLHVVSEVDDFDAEVARVRGRRGRRAERDWNGAMQPARVAHARGRRSGAGLRRMRVPA